MSRTLSRLEIYTTRQRTLHINDTVK